MNRKANTNRGSQVHDFRNSPHQPAICRTAGGLAYQVITHPSEQPRMNALVFGLLHNGNAAKVQQMVGIHRKPALDLISASVD